MCCGASILDPAARGIGDSIAKATGKVIRLGGAFLVYQFSPKVLDFIKPHFKRMDPRFRVEYVPAGDTGRGGSRKRAEP